VAKLLSPAVATSYPGRRPPRCEIACHQDQAVPLGVV